MGRTSSNPRLLKLFAPFRIMAISGAYVVPFFVEHGLSQAQIFLLQSVFSAAYLLWEPFSGYIADKIGHSRSIKISAPLAATGFVAYGLCSEFWQFVLCELLIALASGLVSGADSALLYNSLKAEGRQAQAGKYFQHIKAYGFAAVAVGAPLSVAIVHFYGLGAALIADGLLTAAGMIFVMRLKEAPVDEKSAGQSVRKVVVNLLKDARSRWLIVLTMALSAATYMAVWLTPAFLQQNSVPLGYFAFIAAGRYALKAALGRFCHLPSSPRTVAMYIALVLLGGIAMMPGNLWLIWLLLAHDVVHALHQGPILQSLNERMDSRFRATLNSVVNMFERLGFTVFGPFVGLAADAFGLSVALAFSCAVCAAVATLALWRIGHKL